MKKKNKIIVITIVLIIFMLSFITINISQMHSGKKEVISNNKSVLKQDMLSMMYETTAGSGEYAVSSSNTWPTGDYVFNTKLSGCENGSKLTWDATNRRVLVETTKSDKCYVYFDIKTEETVLFADYIKALYTSQGSNGLYYHATSLTNSAGDNSYRYTGANPNNYVCFGSAAATCPADNLYRIIGVFGNQVKLIKASLATSTQIGTGPLASGTNQFYWSGSSSNRENTWEDSSLNGALSANYLINLGTTWSDMIAVTTWKIGGIAENVAQKTNAQTTYNYEQGINSLNVTYQAKVAMMYLSEYYYAASPTYWTYVGWNQSTPSSDYSAAKNSNWLFINTTEFVLTSGEDGTRRVYAIVYDDEYNEYADGSVAGWGPSYGNGVRPAFSLTATVKYKEGTGTQTNPYRIA